jgi:hypothetical protein
MCEGPRNRYKLRIYKMSLKKGEANLQAEINKNIFFISRVNCSYMAFYTQNKYC